jgi:hypothetical protein
MKPPLMQGAPDDFQTPPEALTPLYPYIQGMKVWECAQGKGYIVRELKSRGFDVIGSDILTGQDFRMWEPNESYDCIVTNPPYKYKQEFLERAYMIGKPFAFLLPLTTFETGARQKLFSKYGLEVIFFDRRVNFETPNQVEKSSSWFATAWFTNGLNIGKQLTFAKLKVRTV